MKLICIILLLVISAYSFELNSFPDSISYEQKRASIASQKTELAKQYRAGKLTLDSAGVRFQELLVNELIPYWYGVPWEFYGHTDSPDSSSIACGYFVSTTLKHLGVNLNRFRMAQQSALNEIKTITKSSDIIRLSHSDTLQNQLLEKMNDGLFIVGLDCHVGYLLKSGDSIYFIHSNYMYPTMVVIEETEESQAFQNSRLYYIGAVSNQKEFIKKWLLGTRVKVMMD